VLILFMVSLFMQTGCGEKIKPGEQRVERPLVTGVGTEQVALTKETFYYEASGTVAAKNTALVSAKVMGEVRDIRAALSDRVRKGDVLLVIHSPDIEARAAAAQEAAGEAGQGLMVAKEQMEQDQEKARLFEKRDELRERLEAIKRDYRKGLDADAEERAIQLENAEVLDAIARATEEELQRIEKRLSDLA